MRRTAIVTLVFSIFFLASFAAAQDAEDSVRVFQKVGPSVVGLESVASSGTGILLDKQGHILTNAHVVAMPLGFKCLVDAERDGKQETLVYKSFKVLGVHPKLDLALAKIDASEHKVELVPASLLKQKAETGQRVYAIGNPGLEGGVRLRKTITEGLLSGVDRMIDEIPYYQFSAAINPGNSGGPLCDRAGNVIGLVTLKRSDLEGVGFAIPLSGLNRADFRPLAERKGDPLQAAQYIAYANGIVDGIRNLDDPEIMNSKPMENLRAAALQAYREALVADPANPTIFAGIGELLTTFKEYEAAEAHFIQALEIAPWGSDSRLYRAYGVLKLAQLKPREAEIIWLEGAAKHPTESRQIWEDLAKHYRANKNWNEVALCANTSIFTSMSAPPSLSRVMPCVQMATEAIQRISTTDAPRLQAQVREFPNDIVRQILRRNALLKSKRLAITKEFGELMAAKNTGLSDALLSDVEPLPIPATRKVSDLLAAADPVTASASGRWDAVNGVWQSPEISQSGVGFTAPAPSEYDLAVEVERVAGEGELVVAFPLQQQTVMFIVDFGGSKSGVAGVRDGLYTSPLLPTNSPISLNVRVRKDTFAVSANGREIYSRAMSERFPATPASWQVPATANVFVGAKNARFRIYGCWLITPVVVASNAPSVATSSEQGLRPRPPVRPSPEATPSITPSAPMSVAAGEIDVREILRIPNLGWGVKSLAISPDNKLVAVGTSDDAVWLFDVATGRRLFAANNLKDLGDITCTQFTSQGDKLLTAGSTGKVSVWDITKERKLSPARAFVGHTKGVGALAVSRDGKFAVSGGLDLHVRYWEIATGRELFAFGGFNSQIIEAQIDADGTYAWATDGKLVLKVKLTSGEKYEVMRPDAGDRAVTISQDGVLFSCYSFRKQNIFKMGAQDPRASLDIGSMTWKAVFSPDSNYMYTGGDGSVSMWDVATQRRIGLIPVGTSAVQVIVISNDGKLMAAISGSARNEVQVFEVASP